MRSREEHLDWCKTRALEYCDRHDLVQAVASMGSDLGKHPETKPSANAGLMMIGMMRASDHDIVGVRKWITGFN